MIVFEGVSKMKHGSNYQSGDWIVHKHYGIGQIRGVEEKMISGEPAPYFRVISERSTFWVPVENSVQSEYIRPVPTAEDCQEVVEVLQRPARLMPDDFRTRKRHISEVENGDSLVDVARLVRDLWARRADKTLNGTEHRALRDLKERLLEEWSVSTGIDKSECKGRMHSLLSITCSD
jgi:RNA polymerase-interacting CarD/CdnL/TRCF family regulator